MSISGMASGTATRRESAKRETREALIAAALAEFAEHGLDAPSLDAICARAGFTRGAFYVHFRDRDDLMVGVLETALGAFLDAMIASGGEADDLERTVDRFAEAITLLSSGDGAALAVAPGPFAGVQVAQLLEGVRRSSRLREGFVGSLRGAVVRLIEVTKRGQAANAVRRDVDPGQVASLLVASALGVLVAREAGMPLDPPALRRAVLLLLAGPPRGPTA
jgi:AcrR family transcriptional regulator